MLNSLFGVKLIWIQDENQMVMEMFGEKKEKPAIEVSLNLGGLLESMGLGGTVDKVLDLIQKGKLEVRVELGTKKKGKIPASLTVRLKKAE